MKQIRLTPDQGTPEATVRKFYDWLLKRRLAQKLPFNVVIVETGANEQYGVLIHCNSLHDRNAVLAALRELQTGTYPDVSLIRGAHAASTSGRAEIGVRELHGTAIGKVFE